MIFRNTGLTLFFAFLWAFALISPAAATPLNNAENFTKTALNAFIQEKQLLNAAPPPALQSIDLNNDLTPEWIAFNPHCVSAKKLCPHVIIAGINKSFVVLGEFNAMKISPASQYTHGIRDILVYNNLKNEYKPVVVKWNSAMSSYTPAQEVALP